MGPKKEEMVDRLQGDGVPVSEMGNLIRDVDREEFQERESMQRVDTFEDPRAQRLSDSWLELGETATAEQKNAVAKAEIVHYMGLDQAIADAFMLNQDFKAIEAVGMKQSGVSALRKDYIGYWTEISEIFPGSLEEKDIKFLAEEGSWAAIRHLRQQLAARGVSSDGLHHLVVNAHAYK